MGLSNAERQRRYRDRKRAEQQQPAPAVTEPVTPSVTGNAVTPGPVDVPELGTRGRRLWRDTTADGGPPLNPRERVLLEEACRTADRLDQLDRILRGDEDAWMRVRVNQDGDEVTVVVTGVLAEVRQQQAALVKSLAELRQSRAGGAGKPGAANRPAVGAGPAATAAGGGGVPAGVADLAARIAARSAQAAG